MSALFSLFRRSMMGALLCSMLCWSCAVTAAPAKLQYTVEFLPQQKVARVEIEMDEARWLKQARFRLHKHKLENVTASGEWVVQGDEALWRPKTRGKARLSYTIEFTRERGQGAYDAYITGEWALLRGEGIVPPISVRRTKNAQVETSVRFVLPEGWSSVNAGWSQTDAPYTYKLTSDKTLFVRPHGWIIAGKLGTRREQLSKTEVAVSAPRGQGYGQMEKMTFLGLIWPQIEKVFPQTPPVILIVGAEDPMWRGGLSAPTSLFMHASRPLVGENGTSTLVHELVHVISGIHGTDGHDWIAEGLAEFYSVELIYRAGGFTPVRREKIFGDLLARGREVKSLRQKSSKGPITDRAAAFFEELDREMQKQSAGRYGLDDLVRLVLEKKYLSTEDLQRAYKQLLGKDSALLASELVR